MAGGWSWSLRSLPSHHSMIRTIFDSMKDTNMAFKESYPHDLVDIEFSPFSSHRKQPQHNEPVPEALLPPAPISAPSSPLVNGINWCWENSSKQQLTHLWVREDLGQGNNGHKTPWMFHLNISELSYMKPCPFYWLASALTALIFSSVQD